VIVFGEPHQWLHRAEFAVTQTEVGEHRTFCCGPQIGVEVRGYSGTQPGQCGPGVTRAPSMATRALWPVQIGRRPRDVRVPVTRYAVPAESPGDSLIAPGEAVVRCYSATTEPELHCVDQFVGVPPGEASCRREPFDRLHGGESAGCAFGVRGELVRLDLLGEFQTGGQPVAEVGVVEEGAQAVQSIADAAQSVQARTDELYGLRVCCQALQ
jgi:hypothetical protein